MTDDEIFAWFLNHARNERDAKLAYFAEMGLPKHEIGEKAGLSGGRSSDPAKRKATYAAAASRALGTKRIRRLREQFGYYRQSGDNPIADKVEIMSRLSAIARGSNDPAAINAAKTLLEDQRRTGPQFVTPQFMRQVVDAACRRQAPLMQALGVASGAMWRDAGVPEMRDWEPPATCHAVTAALQKAGVSPLSVVSLLMHAGEAAHD